MDGAAQQGVDAIPVPSTSSTSLLSSATSSPPSSETETMSSSCRQPKHFVVSAAVTSLSTSQQVGGEMTGQESGQRAEAVTKNADKTSPHPTLITPITPETDHISVPCSAARPAEGQSLPSTEGAQVGDRRWSVVEKKGRARVVEAEASRSVVK